MTKKNEEFFRNLDMAAANQHKLIFVKQTNEPHREKEHVDISDTAKFD